MKELEDFFYNKLAFIFVLKLNISEIKYNSLFGTRAICSNIFQRMSRRYILKITSEYKLKCRINSNVVIKGVPYNTTAR